LYGESDLDYANSTIDVFHQILWWCRGFSTDWKYGDDEVEAWMNEARLLGKYGLSIAFSPHKWLEPFGIALSDLRDGSVIERQHFTFSADRHEMRELIGAINQLLKCRGLAFIDADEGADSYVFILFEAAELERLNKKYGDVSKLIDSKKRVDKVNGRYRDTMHTMDLSGHNDWFGVRDSLFAESVKLFSRDDLEGSMGVLKTLEHGCREQDDLDGLQRALACQAIILRRWEDWGAALKVLKEDECLCRGQGKAGERCLQGNLAQQAWVLYETRDLNGALKARREEERMCREYRDKKPLQDCLSHQVVILSDKGDQGGMSKVLDELIDICRVRGDEPPLEGFLGTQAIILMDQGGPDRALESLMEQERICRKIGNDQHLQASLSLQATILQEAGDHDGAMSRLSEAEALCRRHNDREELQNILGKRALILYENSDLSGALALNEEREALCRALDLRAELARALLNRALVLSDLDRAQEAVPLINEARAIAETSGDHESITAVKMVEEVVYRI